MAVKKDGILTVGITSYNYDQYIADAIESVINQTSPNWRLVIYDNGSTDNTIDVVTPYLQDERVSLVVQPENIGARNNSVYSVRQADSEFFSCLQADDFLENTFVENALKQFEQSPTAPFVFFDWTQFMDESKTHAYHERLPFPQHRAGPILIGPLLTICNFVPLHMAAFRTECLQYVYEFFLESPLKQVGEQYILKILEDTYGVGCYSGTMGGSWRRHGEQITESQLSNGVAILEEMVERHWYVNQAPNPSYVNVFMALATALNHSSRIGLLKSSEWLLHTEGQRYAESFNVPIEENVDRLRTVALVVALKFSSYTSIPTLSHEEFTEWMELLKKPLSRSGLLSLLEEVKTTEGEVFINQEEINKICSWAFVSENVVNDPNKIPVTQNIEQQYEAWVEKNAWHQNDAQYLAERMMIEWQKKPSFHLVILLLPDQEELLNETMNSLANQYYSSWHLSVLSVSSEPDSMFSEMPQLNWFQVDGEDIYDDINYVIEQIDADWVSFVPAGTSYEPHTLATVSDYINLHPEWFAIYSDDDQVNLAGNRTKPRFKPDFNLDLLRSSPYTGLLWINKSALKGMNGIKALPTAENYDLALRCIDTFGEQAIGHIADVIIHIPEGHEFDEQLGLIALKNHLSRKHIQAEVNLGLIASSYRVEYIHQTKPLVSIIIPNKDNLELLQVCVESVFAKTDYTHFEVIIVDNQSTDDELKAYYLEIGARFGEQVQIFNFDQLFNFAAINNLATAHAKGEYLLLLNNDTEIIQPEWLTRMLLHAQREEVGIVGAKLIYPNSGSVQHAGVVLGMGVIPEQPYEGVGQVADHPFNGSLLMNEPGYMGRAQLEQNYSAVTGACLLIRKSVYESCSGMREDTYKVLYNDLDLCLRVGQLGYKIVWTPHSLLIHHANVSIQKEAENLDNGQQQQKIAERLNERQSMWQNWMSVIANDPAYNKNLVLDSGFYIDQDVAKWDRNISSRPKYLALISEAADLHSQPVKQAFGLMTEAAIAQCQTAEQTLTHVDIARIAPDTVLFQQSTDPFTIDIAASCKTFVPDVFVVISLDDGLYDYAMERFDIATCVDDFNLYLKDLAESADRCLVTNQALMEQCSAFTDDVIVMPNRLPAEVWGELKTPLKTSDKPRVGWVLNPHDHGEYELLTEVIQQTAEYIDWVLIGDCPDAIKSEVQHAYQRPNAEDYPILLASIDLELAVYPLCEHPLNFVCSHQQLLEFGVLGYPVLASQNVQFNEDFTLFRTENNVQSWVASLLDLVKDRTHLADAGEKLKQSVKAGYMLENSTEDWAYALSNQPDAVTKGIQLTNLARGVA